MGSWSLGYLLAYQDYDCLPYCEAGFSTFPRTGDTWFAGALCIHYNLGTEIPVLQEEADKLPAEVQIAPCVWDKGGVITRAVISCWGRLEGFALRASLLIWLRVLLADPSFNFVIMGRDAVFWECSTPMLENMECCLLKLVLFAFGETGYSLLGVLYLV